MQDYIENFQKMMVIKNFSQSTQKGYSSNLKKFLEHCKNQEKVINSESLKDYLYDLIQNNKMSLAMLKQSIGAAKFFLSSILISPTN